MTPPPHPPNATWPPDLAVLVDQICNRYEAELKAGGRPDLERILADVPEAVRAALEAELHALEQAYARQQRISLRVTAGPHQGREFTFAGHDTLIVGRSKRAHFRLADKDKYFSRFHFMVEVNPPCCRVLDMNSRNGTHVNGQKVQLADLHDGDQIKAGHTILRVALLHSAASATDAAPSAPATVPHLPPAPVVGSPQPVATDQGLRTTDSANTTCRICAAPALPGEWLCAACHAEAQTQAQLVPGYVIVRKLGQGGMGVVYQALRNDGSVVAVKTVAPAMAGSKTDLDRFLREARILGELHHLYIVRFFEMGEANGRLFFVMEYVPGTDARRLLKDHGPLAIDRALRLGRQLLEALEHAHDQGFVHRDIKPANLLVTSENGEEVIKLADFGLARVYQASNMSGLTLKGDIGGTAAFIAPEQITNFRESKPPVDQYAAAATLYNLLTNRYIFDMPEKFQDQFLKILHEQPVPIRKRRPEVPEELAALIHKALAKEPGKRFADVRAMRRALMKFCY